jgi:hypothetical protein
MLFTPKPSKNITLESSIDNVKSDILCTAKVNTDTFDNLTPVEGTALQILRSNEDIIIKPADKGSAVVDMDKSAYIREAERPTGVRLSTVSVFTLAVHNISDFTLSIDDSKVTFLLGFGTHSLF